MNPTEKYMSSQPENKEQNPHTQEQIDEQKNTEKNEVVEQTNSALEWLDITMLNNYFSNALVWKEFWACSKEQQSQIEEMRQYTEKRLQKLMRVPLDIKIDAWIGGLMSIVSLFNTKAAVPQESLQQIQSMTWAISSFDKMRDQFDAKIQQVLAGFSWLSGNWSWVLQQLEKAFWQIEQRVVSLKQDREKLKQEAKAQWLSIKAYYQSQTRQYMNEFLLLLQGSKSAGSINGYNTQNTMSPVYFDTDSGIVWDYDDLEYPNVDSNLEDLKYIDTNDMISIHKMCSWAIEKNPKTWTTLCSKTAADNLERLWIKNIMRGNAFDVKDVYNNKYKIGDQIWDAKIVSMEDKFTNTIKWNTFDIFIPAKSEKNKTYWHRLVWFRSEPSNQIYVIDPYNVKYDGKSSTKPQKIEDFISSVCNTQKREIVKIVWYETKKIVVDNEQVITHIKQQRNTQNLS